MGETKLDSFFATVQINLSGSRTPYRKEITRTNVGFLVCINRNIPSRMVSVLKCLWSSHPEVFLIKGVLKIYSKVTGENLCRSVISIKLLCNFIEITLRHGRSPVNFLHIFRTPFPKNVPVKINLKKQKCLIISIYTPPPSECKNHLKTELTKILDKWRGNSENIAILRDFNLDSTNAIMTTLMADNNFVKDLGIDI